MLVVAILLAPAGVTGPGDRAPDHCDRLPDPPGKALGIDKQCPQAGSSAGVARGDFNGDGFADLAIGVPDEDLTTRSTVGGTTPLPDAGVVIVIYGSADGLDASGSDAAVPAQLWHQNVNGVLDTAQSGDRFGAALAAGDFNGDERSDLAIAIPSEDGGGAVHILPGSDAGLTADGDQLLSDSVTGPGPRALAWGNFDDDQFGDLAVGSIAGRVRVLYGTSSGLGQARLQVWDQDSEGVPDQDEVGDGFGFALAAGDFDGDDADDLAVGVPFEDLAANSDGAVTVIYGQRGAGLTTAGREADFWHRNVPGFEGENTSGDTFGRSLAAGDLNADLRDDLVIGADRTDVERPDGTVALDAGAVHVVYGSPGGLSLSATLPDQLWHQNSSGIEDTAETSDRFGGALAAADFDGDGAEDIAVGTGFEDVGAVSNAGAVNIIYGSTDEGLDSSDDELFHQDSSGIQDEAEANDLFGSALSAWNFGNGGPADLAVGVPSEDLVTPSGLLVENAGLVNVLYGGSSGGLSDDGDQLWTQDTDGIPNSAESDDHFGLTLY